MKRPTKIKSAKQAHSEYSKLKKAWSEESLLSLRTLIYIASLLEKIVAKNP